jgi:predicted transposase/invertase (TIGR01784 family)
MVAEASPALKKVVGKLMELSDDERARMLYESQLKRERDERARLRGAREEGKNEGRAEGEKKGCLEIAQKLIAMKMLLDQIVQATGLPIEDIEKLQADPPLKAI